MAIINEREAEQLNRLSAQMMVNGLAAHIKDRLREMIKPQIEQILTEAATELAASFVKVESIRDCFEHKVVTHFMFQKKEGE